VKEYGLAETNLYAVRINSLFVGVEDDGTKKFADLFVRENLRHR
jgi:hypothetical protein